MVAISRMMVRVVKPISGISPVRPANPPIAPETATAPWPT
jgi:hypothetical protein